MHLKYKLGLAVLLFAGCSRQPEDKGELLPLQYKIDSLQHVIDSLNRLTASMEPSLSGSTTVRQSKSYIDDSIRKALATTSSISGENKDPLSISEWKKFRDDEDKYINRAVKWRVKIYSIPGGVRPQTVDAGDAYAFLEGNPNLQCALLTHYLASLHEGDWIIVEGKFYYVTGDGKIMIDCKKITKAERPAYDNY